LSEIRMIEPTDPEERSMAIRMCRANARIGKERWVDVQSLVPYAKWIWMWNHGREEWDPTARSDAGEQG